MTPERERLVADAVEARNIQAYWNTFYPRNLGQRITWMWRAIKAARALAAYDRQQGGEG